MTRAQSLQAEIAYLEKTYGKGVRPSWVSTELAILRRQLEHLNE